MEPAPPQRRASKTSRQKVGRCTIKSPSTVAKRTPPRDAGVVPIVLSAGLRAIWRPILNAAGLDWVPLVATELPGSSRGARAAPPLIVCAAGKAAAAGALSARATVTAFGDSKVDLKMAAVADSFVLVQSHRATLPSVVAAVAPRARILASFSGTSGETVHGAHEMNASAPPAAAVLPPVSFGQICAEAEAEGRWPSSVTHFTEHPFSRSLATSSRRHDVRGAALCGVHAEIGAALFTDYSGGRSREAPGRLTLASRGIALRSLYRGAKPPRAFVAPLELKHIYMSYTTNRSSSDTVVYSEYRILRPNESMVASLHSLSRALLELLNTLLKGLGVCMATPQRHYPGSKHALQK